jgi:NAD-dependent SIR2 family protein deacetylase
MKTYSTAQLVKQPELLAKVHQSKRVVVLAGAGLSCSSGIPDFRSADGFNSTN